MRVAYFALAVCLLSPALFAAENPFLGTWVLNTAKSKFSPGPGPKNETVKFEQDGDKIRRTVTGTDGQGNPIMEGGPEGTSILWDGEDHTVTKPSDPPMTVAVKRVNDYTNAVTVKQQGKVINNIRSVVSKNGKKMTNSMIGTNEKGQKIRDVEVLDKQ
jgi:hypothetical protein